MKFSTFCQYFKGLFSRYEPYDEEKPDPIYLMSSDYDIIKTYEDDIRVSRILSSHLDIAGDEKYAMVFFFPEVSGEILRHIIKYGAFHKNDERRKERAKKRDLRDGIQHSGPSDFRKNKIKPTPGYWDKKFMENVKTKDMYLLLEATMSLEITSLKDLIFIYTAFSLRDKNDDQIRSMLHIPRDIDSMEEAEIHNQTAFLASGN